MADQNERNGTSNGGDMQAQGGNGNGKRSNRGFASMDASRQREIASKGGKAAHAKGTAHEWTPDEARVAGRKGGEAVSRDRAHMAAIGREGGGARGRNARAQSQSSGSSGSQSSGRGEESRSASPSSSSRSSDYGMR
jgi:general stress protein YciG